PPSRGVKPALTPRDHPGNRAAAKAVARAFGKEPLFFRDGGSGPERALSDALGAACVYVGVMLPPTPPPPTLAPPVSPPRPRRGGVSCLSAPAGQAELAAAEQEDGAERQHAD